LQLGLRRWSGLGRGLLGARGRAQKNERRETQFQLSRDHRENSLSKARANQSQNAARRSRVKMSLVIGMLA
jgi:hypothetical protein